jgi:Rho termination factor, N-terminal domain.
MEVKLLKPTNWGKPLKVGAELDVDDATARRWMKKGIAEPVGELHEVQNDGRGEGADNPPKELAVMNYAELRELAKEKEVQGYSKMNKEALLETLMALQPPEEENEDSNVQPPNSQNPDGNENNPPTNGKQEG